MGQTSWTAFFNWQTPIDRMPYFAWGAGLLALKYNLDRTVASFAFEQPWSIFSYMDPAPGQGLQTLITSGNLSFYATMVALALPFILVGTVLTLRRLRSIGLPPGLVAFFFLPVVNILFFLSLSVLPSREAPDSKRAFWERWIPQSPLGSALAGLLVTLPVGLLLTLVGVLVFNEYGWGLFVGIPFMMGLFSVLIFGFKQDRDMPSCVSVSAASVILLGVGFVAFAIEGILCILMAAPIGVILAVMGGILGYFIQKSSRPDSAQALMFLLSVLSLPALMGFEKLEKPAAPLIAVKTSIDIAAPPETVWKNVVEFSALPPPTDWLLKLGIAYPIRAEIKGRGVGAVRHCIFTTGPFVEPITVWDEPRLLQFKVTEQPHPMQEWTPYKNLNPPHLDHFLESQKGQFHLEPLPNGSTRLEGTTWYIHKIWPGRYWQFWSDEIIHRIHLRVLKHIQALSETPVPDFKQPTEGIG